MSSPASSWSISVKTVGGSESIRAAKASSSQESNNSKKITLDCDGGSINSDSASSKDPPVNLKSHHRSNSSNSNVQMIEVVPSDFTVDVQSSDKLSMLHSKIEEVTGLHASQQRLIYRGRLITKHAANSSKDDDLIGDIEGLCDGQTIHLVPRPLPNRNNNNSSGNTGNADVESGNSTRPRSNSAGNNTATGNGTSAATSLIATLLGLSVPSSVGSSNNNNSSATDEEDLDVLSSRSYQSSNSVTSRERRRQIMSISNTSNSGTSSRRSPSSTNNNATSSRRGGRNRSNAYNAGVWERNPIEPLRQGLMTLHTLLESHPSSNDINESHDKSYNSSVQSSEKQDEEVLEERKMSYLEVARGSQVNINSVEVTEAKPQKQKHLLLPPKWYLGQWLDVKDTVDQWLEATIDKIVFYKDIFTLDQIREYESNAALVSSASEKEVIRKHNLKVDPIVGAGDKEGCKSLFLEEMPTHLDEAGFPLMKFKDNYENTQLILVHYNSWPHRWDEWINGDSKRISIFRTKTRHPPSAPFASPTPNSHYFEAPTTHIFEEGEHDNAAILPELCLAMSKVQRLLNAAIPSSPHNCTKKNFEDQSISSCTVANANRGMDNSTNNFPWGRSSTPRFNNDVASYENSQIQNVVQDVKEDSDDTGNIDPSTSTILEGLSREQLGSLAPILDRLGRTLTDIAPHIAELSSSLPSEIKMDSDSNLEDEKNPEVCSEEFAEAQISQSTEEASTTNIPETIADENSLAENLNTVIVEEHERPENDLSTDSRVVSSASHSSVPQQSNPNPHHPHADRYQGRSATQLQNQNAEPIDYSLSLVNTSRDENPTRRSRQSSSNQDSTSSFLGTYLAARGVADEDRDAGSTLARLLRVGSGGLTGSDSNGGSGVNTGNGGGGIDIHIHAIVTPVGGGGGMDVGIGLPDMGAFPFVGLQPVSQDGTSTSEAEPGTSTSGSTGETQDGGITPIINNVTVPDLDDDLFSDLYTESPTPFEFARNEFVEESERNHVNNNTNTEETFPLTAYSMVVGDIPTLSSDEQENVETPELSPDFIEENRSLSEDINTTILPVTNLNESPSSSLSPQGQPIAQQNTASAQSSSGSSLDLSNTRGRRRHGFALGRLARAFRRNPSSRGTGSNSRNKCK